MQQELASREKQIKRHLLWGISRVMIGIGREKVQDVTY